MRLTNAIRTVALIEAAKGAMVLMVGFGLVSLGHGDVQRTAEGWVAQAHLNPDAHYPRVFFDLVRQVTAGRLALIAAGTLLYAGLRFVEAYGLWFERRWAEWLAALSCTLYIPFELFELAKRVTPLGLGALVVNLTIVAFMTAGLRSSRRVARLKGSPAGGG